MVKDKIISLDEDFAGKSKFDRSEVESMFLFKFETHLVEPERKIIE